MAGALAGTLLIDIAANTAKLVQGFADAEAKSKSFVDGLKKLGGAISGVFSVHQVIAFGDAIQHSVDAMADMADNLKLPVQDFQALQNSALLAGQSIESTSTALGKFNVFIGKAAEGSKDQIERLNELGVKILDVNGKVRPTTDLLQEVALAITKISDPARRAAAEVDIFGKSGQSISAILPQFAKGAAALNAELSAMGLVHGPETVKAFAEMSDKADIASKKIEVFFGYFYAIGKSTVLDAVAKGLQGITNAINALQLGSAENMIRVLTALALIGTVAGAPAGLVMLTTGIDDAATILNKQIEATSKSIETLEKDLEAYKKGGAAFAQQTMETAGQIALLELRRSDLLAKQKALNPLAVTVTQPPPGASQPAIKGPAGVDKYAEAMRKLKEETQATSDAIEDFNKRTAAGENGKEAERQAKLIIDIGRARTKVLTDIPQGIDPKPLQEMAEALVKLKFNLDELVRAQQIADGVHKEFGDGTRELKDRMVDLDKAYRDGKISIDEYKAAVKGAQEAQQKQAQVAAEAKGGIDGFVGGLQAGAAQIEKATSAFAMGQEAILGTWRLMSDAISEFVQTGEFNFKKFAAGFAKMLADMLAKWAAAQIILAGLKAIGFASGAGSTAGVGLSSMPAPASAGMRALGGPVVAGMAYTVGERGPERFVPAVSGRVDPNGGGGGGDVNVFLDMKKAEGARDAGAALEFGRRVKVAVQGVIENEKRPGGTLYAGRA